VRITLLVKGNLRARRRLRKDLETLRALLPAAQLTVVESEYGGHSVELAAAARDRTDYLIAVGGDGTLHELLNGCLRVVSGEPLRKLPVIGVLPYGSANDYARSAGIEQSAEQLARLIAQGTPRAVDVGALSCQGEDGNLQQRYFLNATDVGIGAGVIRRLEHTGKRFGGQFSYMRATLATFFGYRPQCLSIETDTGLHWRGKTLILVAANGRYFGSGLGIAPGARLDDGSLFITRVGDASVLDFARKFRQIRRGKRLQHPAVSYARAGRISVAGEGGEAPVEADGEFLGYTPLEISMLPAAIRLLVPAEGATGGSDR
jgi:YegS/Rv2252/BmrU family lipid kinase